MHAALAAVLLASGHAEVPEPLPKNVVLADLGQHVVGVGFQRTLSDFLAAQVSVDLWVPWPMNQNFLGLAGTEDKGDVTGFVGRARVFLYPEGHAPIGPWLSPFVQAGVGQDRAEANPAPGLVWAAGAAVGWAWLPFAHLHLALGAGVQYHAGPTFGRLFSHIDLNAGFAL